MKSIKEHNFLVKDENITIRSINNNDLIFYKNWFKKGHILQDKVNTLTDDDIETMLFFEIKRHLFLIIEVNEKPVGEITIWNDDALILLNKEFKKPFYSVGMIFYENVSDNDINIILKIFINSINKFKLKKGTLYSMIDENIEPNYTNNYFYNGFENLKREHYKTKLEKTFLKMGIDNPYDKLKMLLKKL